MPSLGKVFLLLGPEYGEKKRFLSKLRAEVAKEAGGPIEESSHYPFDIDVDALISYISTGALFASHKLVIIPQVETLKGRGATILGEYCRKPSRGTTVVLLSDGSARDISKSITGGIPKEQTRIFWELFGNQKLQWVRSFFRERGLKATEDSLQLILDMVENNTYELERECSKLALFFSDRLELTHDDVEGYLFHGKEESVFSLFDVCVAGDFPRAIEVMNKLMISGGNHIQIVGGIVWQLRRLHTLSLLRDEHVSFENACDRVGIMGKRIRSSYQHALQLYTSRNIEGVLAIASMTDGELRRGDRSIHNLVLEMFVYYLVIKKGSAPEPYSA